MEVKKLLNNCFTILYKTPKNIETNKDTFLENVRYELFNSRCGKDKGKDRDIGSANIIELGIYLKSIYDIDDEENKNISIQIMDTLVDENRLRIKPEVRREESIKLVWDNPNEPILVEEEVSVNDNGDTEDDDNGPQAA